jgi:outer membrane protein assembly complex protein YaeT
MKNLFNTQKKRIFLRFFLLLFVLIVAGMFFLQSRAFKSYIITRMDRYLRSHYNLSLSTESFNFNLARLAFTFEGVQVMALQEATLPLKLFSASRLHVNLSFAAIFSRKVHIQKLEIAQPRIVLKQEMQQSAGASPVEPARDAVRKKPLVFQIDDFILTNGSIVLNDRDYAFHVSLSDIIAQAQYYPKEQTHKGFIRSQNGEIRLSQSNLILKKLLLGFNFNSDSIQIDRFLIDSEPLSVEASGWIRDYLLSPQYLFDIRGSFQLDQIQPLLKLDNRYAGNLTLTGTVQGEGSQAKFSGKISGQDNILANIPVAKFETAFEADKTALSVSKLNLDVAEGILGGTLNIPFIPEREASVLLHWDSLNLLLLSKSFSRFPLLFSSHTSGKLSAGWRTHDFKTIEAEGEITLNSSETISSSRENRIHLDGQIKFKSSKGSIEIYPSDLALDNARLSFSGSLDKSQAVKARLQLKADDLSEIENLIIQLKKEGYFPQLHKLPPVHFGGRFALSGNVAGTLLEPQVSLNLDAEEISFNQMQIPLIKAALAYKHKLIDVSQLWIEFQKGQVEGKGRISYNLQKNTFGESLEFTLRARELDTAPIIASLPVPYAVHGLVSGEARFSGRLSDPEAEFKASFFQLMFQREDIPRVEIEGHYQRKNLQLSKLGVFKGDGVLEGTLSLNPARRSYTVNLTGKAFNLADFKSLSPEKNSISGRINFTIEGRGTFERPEFTLSLSVEKPRAFNKGLEFIEIKADSDGTILKSHLHFPEGQTAIEASLLLKDPYIIKGYFSTTSLDAVNIMRTDRKVLPAQVGSEITASGSFSIPLKNWNDSALLIKMEKAAFNYRGLTVQNQRPVVLNFENEEMIIQDFRFSGPNTEFSISGGFPLNEKKKGQIKAEGTIQLQLLEPFLPGFEVSGALALQSEITGSITKPSLNAQIELMEGRVISAVLPYHLHDFVFRAKIEENTVSLEKFSVGVDEGNISARGKFYLTSLLPNARRSSAPGKENKENDIEVTFTGLDLSKVARLASKGLAEEFVGLVEGSLHLRGAYTSLSQLEIDGKLSRLLLSLSQFKLENDNEIKISLKDSAFHLNELRLSGSNSSILASGSIDLAREPKLDVRFIADLDSAALTPFLKNVILGGKIILNLNFNGLAADPAIIGTGEIKDGFFEVQDYPVLATNIKGNLQFSESTVTFPSLQGIVNGGTVNIQGKLSYRAFKIEIAKAEITAERVQLNYPEGLWAQANGMLSLAGNGNQWFLSGEMKVTQAFYGMNVFPSAELMNSIRFRRARIGSEVPPLLQNLNLDVGIMTVDSLVIDNNLAKLELAANIRLLGTVVEPRISGRIANRYVGKITFGDRSFEVEQAIVDFLGEDPLDGRLNVIAHTNLTHKYDNLEITLILSGPITNPNISLSSFPPRSQAELASLLITGYGTEKLRSETANIISNQMILYFASPLASPVTQKIKNLLRAEEVSIEPINIATEADPGARFTFRKGLIKHVDVVYSIDVSNTQQQTWVLDYNLSRNFSIHSFRKDDGSYGASLSHRFFLSPSIPKSQAPFGIQSKRFLIKEVKLEGNLAYPRHTLVKKTRLLQRGSAFNYGDLQKSIENLIRFYKEKQYLNAVINPVINYEDNRYATIALNIDSRKPSRIVYSGDPISKKLKNEVVDSWNGRLPEEMAMAEARNRIISDLKSKGFYEAEVEAKKDIQERQAIYAISVKLGPHYHIQKFTISGKSMISPETIRKETSIIPNTKGKGLWILLYDFKRASPRIKDLYAEEGYPNAQIGHPEVSVDRNLRFAHMSLPVEEGSQTRVCRLEIKGARSFGAEELKKGLRLTEKSIYRPSLLSEDNNYLYNFYRSKGYQDVNVTFEIIPEPEGPDMSLVYTINEGELHTIGVIEFSGNYRTPDYFIRRELLFKPGDPVNQEILILSQKKLYDLSIFKTVNIRRQTLGTKRNQEKILVEVEEEPRFAASYGARYNSEEKFEGFGQLDFINILGRGRKGLVYYRENKREKDLRFSLKDPYLFGKRFNTLHSFYYSTEIKARFKTEEIGYTLQQEVRLPFDFSLSYLYRFNRIHTYEIEPIGPFAFDITLFLSELQTFLVRDTRINKLNARQGSFFSLSFTYSPEFLGSDLTYISLFCQYSLYKTLSSRVVWASNYRVGLADAFDQVMIPSKRFYAGGGNSVRGFKRDMVGPIGPFLQSPEGGEALFIMNQELRFPIYKWLESVMFVDAGNVFANLGDFNPFDVRKSVGLGLRLNTPAVLIRVDYGRNICPRLGEPKGVFFLSIGQAF